MTDRAAQAIIAQIDRAADSEQHVIVFNSVPHPHKALVSVETDIESPLLVDGDGKSLPAEVTLPAIGKTRVRFLSESAGLGHKTFWLRAGGKTTPL